MSVRPELRVVSVGLVVWAIGFSVFGWIQSAWLIAAVGVAWLLLQRSHWGLRSVPVLALVAAPPLALMAMNVGGWLDAERLAGLPHNAADRSRAQETPNIAPGFVFADRPQEFIVHAPQMGRLVSVRFDFGGDLEPTYLGAGLYRVRYDPRHDGAPTRTASSHVHVRSELGGEVEQVTLGVDVDVVELGPHPRWTCRSPDGSTIVVTSEESDEVYVVRDGEFEPIRLDVGDGPCDCVFTDDARVLVAHRYSGARLLDTRSMGQRRLAAAGHRVARGPSGEVALLHRDGVTTLGADFQPRAHVDLREPDWAAFTASGALVVATRRDASLHRLVSASGSLQPSGEPLHLGRPAVTLTAHGDDVWVALTDYSPGEPHLGNHFVQDQLVRVNVPRWEVVEQRLTARRSPAQGSAGNVDRGVSPMALDVHEGALTVAFAGSDEVGRYAGVQPRFSTTSGLPAPHGLAHFASGSMLVTSPSRGAIGVRVDGSWQITDLIAADASDVSHAQRRGERAFYEGTRSGVSCQSCHLHGDTDFVRRNIGGGRLAPTLGVGGVYGTSPYLRDASYPRIRDLDHLSQTLLRGFVRADSRRGDDLEAFIRATPRRDPPDRSNEDAEAVVRGAEVFQRARCASCHTGATLSHLGQIPLGALFPEQVTSGRGADEVLDTPSLLSVGTHGPYLDDGRAPSLLAIFKTHNPDNRHGDTEGLGDEELADLVRFLEAL